ncbi:hypothetical protein EDC01DRAFT_620111 [Geopyxis carbonaria]|nr:hypothetical protein EDC01DRAFT_620111 [Geopyxis carbonaria]
MGSSLSTPAPAPEAGGVWGSSRGSELRAQAHAATAACQAAARDSQAAWRANRKAEAAILSAESKRAAALRDALHLQAEEEIFQFFNPDYPSAATAGGGGLWGWMLGAWGGMGADGEVKDGLRRCDLHGLLVKEAVGRVEAHLRTCRERGVERTLIITGRGLHSDGGVAKVKPEVETWLRGQRVSVQWVDGGGAADVVLLEAQQEPEGWAAWGWKQIFG